MELPAYLERFHFTAYERAVIIALAQVENASAGELVKAARVPQGKIYATIDLLSQKGIVKKIPTRPKRFSIPDVHLALRSYLEESRRRIADDEAALQALELRPKALPQLKTPSSVAFFSGRDEHIRVQIQLRDAAQKELRQMAPVFVGTYASRQSLQQAIGRGVRIRILIHEMNAQNRKNIEFSLRAGAEIRRCADPKRLLSMTVRDDAEFIIHVHNYADAEDRLILLSKSPSLMNVLIEQFEREWRQGKKVVL